MLYTSTLGMRTPSHAYVLPGVMSPEDSTKMLPTSVACMYSPNGAEYNNRRRRTSVARSGRNDTIPILSREVRTMLVARGSPQYSFTASKGMYSEEDGPSTYWRLFHANRRVLEPTLRTRSVSPSSGSEPTGAGVEEGRSGMTDI